MACRLHNLHDKTLGVDLRGGEVLILLPHSISRAIVEEALYDNHHLPEWERAGWVCRIPARMADVIAEAPGAQAAEACGHESNKKRAKAKAVEAKGSKENTSEERITEDSIAEESVAEESVAEESVAEESVAEESVAEESGANAGSESASKAQPSSEKTAKAEKKTQ